jgi:hypothetical protein
MSTKSGWDLEAESRAFLPSIPEPTIVILSFVDSIRPSNAIIEGSSSARNVRMGSAAKPLFLGVVQRRLSILIFMAELRGDIGRGFELKGSPAE